MSETETSTPVRCRLAWSDESGQESGHGPWRTREAIERMLRGANPVAGRRFWLEEEPGDAELVATDGYDRIAWIRRNLPTYKTWTKADLREFYEHDVTFLLGEIDRLKEALWKAEQAR